MRHRLIRVVTAAVMGVGVAIPVTAQPAQADVGTVISVINGIYQVYQKFAMAGQLTLPQAVAQIEAQIQSSQTAIISQIDRVAAANVQACASSAVINFADINAFTPDNLQAYALAATDCVTQADSLLGAVTDKAATDNIGFAMNTVGPLALMARIKAGLTTPALTNVLVAGENTLISALLPACRKVNDGDPDHPFFDWTCTAYNGDVGVAAVFVRNSLTLAQDQATANTSRAVAQAALPTL